MKKIKRDIGKYIDEPKPFQSLLYQGKLIEYPGYLTYNTEFNEFLYFGLSEKQKTERDEARNQLALWYDKLEPTWGVIRRGVNSFINKNKINKKGLFNSIEFYTQATRGATYDELQELLEIFNLEKMNDYIPIDWMQSLDKMYEIILPTAKNFIISQVKQSTAEKYPGFPHDPKSRALRYKDIKKENGGTINISVKKLLDEIKYYGSDPIKFYKEPDHYKQVNDTLHKFLKENNLLAD